MMIFAHRGASGEFPENTLDAFQQAIYQKADGIELDVFEVDGEFYIWHDRFLPAPAVCELPLWQLTKAQIQQFRAASGQSLPTLSEALTLIRGQCMVNIEIKYLNNVTAFSHLLRHGVEHLGFQNRQLLVSSFDHWCLKALREENAECLIGVLFASSPLTLRDVIAQLRPYSVHLAIDCLRTECVQLIHQHGLQCYVYTVDSKPDIALVRTLGGDGVFTNFPARSRAISDALK